MTVVSDSPHQSTLDAVCICSAVVGVPHRPLLPSLPTLCLPGGALGVDALVLGMSLATPPTPPFPSGDRFLIYLGRFCCLERSAVFHPSAKKQGRAF